MPSLITRLKAGFKRIVLSQVCYVDTQRYQCSLSGNLTPLQADNARIVVLSRHCYAEQVQWLPVNRRREAKKLVKFQQSTRGADSFYVIGQPLNGKTPVTWYTLTPQAVQSQAWLYLPETLLLSAYCEPQSVLVYQSPDRQSDIFVASSLAGSVSALKGGFLQSASQFMLTQGSNTYKTINISSRQHCERLLRTLFHLYRLPLAGLFNKAIFRRNNSGSTLGRYVLPLAVSVTVYLLLAVQWTTYQQQASKLELRSANAEANTVLMQRENINAMAERYKQLQQVLPASDNLLQVWQVLAPLYQQGVIVTSVQQRQQLVTLRIEAASATEALQLLVKQPGVIDARVDGNVRRQSNKDVATVSFQLQREGV